MKSRPYTLTGEVVRINEGDCYFILQHKDGSKYKIFYTESARRFFHLGKSMGVICVTCKKTGVRLLCKTASSMVIGRNKKNSTSKCKAVADARTLQLEYETAALKPRCNYNAELPAVKNKPVIKEKSVKKDKFGRAYSFIDLGGHVRKVPMHRKSTAKEIDIDNAITREEQRLAYEEWKRKKDL